MFASVSVSGGLRLRRVCSSSSRSQNYHIGYLPREVYEFKKISVCATIPSTKMRHCSRNALFYPFCEPKFEIMTERQTDGSTMFRNVGASR